MCTPTSSNPFANVQSGSSSTAPVAAAPAPTGSAGLLGNIGLGLQAAGAFTGAAGAYKQSKSNQQALKTQAAVAEYQAKDAERRGALSFNKHRLQVAQMKGTQTASLAARGLALDEGSALNILMDTDYMGEVDAATIKDNTAKEAWALRTNASQLRQRAKDEMPLLTAGTSLLGSAGSVAKSWYAMKNKKDIV